MKTLEEVLWKNPNGNTPSDEVTPGLRMQVTCGQLQSCCNGGMLISCNWFFNGAMGCYG